MTASPPPESPSVATTAFPSVTGGLPGDFDGRIILRAEELYHVYESKAIEGNVVALRGLTLQVKTGEAVAVIGPSGAGKSTLLQSLGGLMKPSAGRVFLQGLDITQLEGKDLVEARRSTVSFIFQEGNLLPHLSALDNVMQPLRHQGVPIKVAKERAIALLDRLGMVPRMKALPEKLSGGEQQRVAIARALITNPKIILADEPTGALDPVTSRRVLKLFRELHEEEQTAFLVVTHSDEVAAFADRALELRDGRFISQHGGDFDLDDLVGSRELIIDDLGTLVLPPDLLTGIGGPGTFRVADAGTDRLVLERSGDNGVDGNLIKRDFAATCPACGHAYSDSDEDSCPSCGVLRPRA